MRSYYILGMRVDDVTFDEALSMIDEYIQSGKSHRVVTPNPEFAMAARGDPHFLKALNGSSLAIPDGIGLMLAARLAGQRFREHVRGTDLVHRAAALCARKGYRMFLLGAAPGVAEEAAARLVEANPGLQIAGCFAGVSGPQGDDETVAAISRAGRVDLILVAYGAPAQEAWLARNQERLGIPCGIGVGGVFNFLSGRSKRAPAWVRRIELEWLYRLITEPWRWKRQLVLPVFALTVLWERVRGRRPVRDAF
ncbi:MAG TPA: WecB/TagA/CpsF family glycosyltransferase [Chloroflexota bacterium]|nr:WecB/TagA/CpsF family glycosyltransferase [Chloroflexota bacterium]